MDQIRFDFSAQIVTAFDRKAATPVPGGTTDAFSQVLDQQMARAKDNAAQQSQDNPRSSEDWRRPTDNGERHDTERPRTANRRRDDKANTHVTTAAAKPKVAQKTNSPADKSPTDKATDTADAAASSAKAKPQADMDDKKDTAAAGQPANDSGTATTAGAAKEEQNGDADPNGQQPGDGSDDQSSAQKQDPDATTDADLAAAMIPLPLQTIGIAVTVKGNGPAAAVSPAVQAALLVAAGLTSLPVNLAAAADAQPQTDGAGLKFGAVAPKVTSAEAKAAASARATTGTDTASDPAVDSGDPSAEIAVSTAMRKPQANSTASSSSKARNAAAAFSPVTAAYAGQSGTTTSLTQQASASVASAWATRSAAALAAGGFAPTSEIVASGDSDLSGWPQYLDAGLSGSASASASGRAAAFLAELKQNVQLPPAHEQVAIQIQKAMQNGSNRLTLNLEPAELGRVEVKLDVDKDKNVTASIVVDRPATLDMLQRDAKALERALQDAGLQTNDGSLSFSLRNSGGQGGSNGSNGQAGAGMGGGNAGSQASDTANQLARADVISTADGYVDVET